MVLAPLKIVDRRRIPGVVAVGVWGTGKLGERVIRTRIVTVHVPVQPLGCVVEDSVHGLPRSRGGGEQERPGEGIRIALAEYQVAVARQDAHVVAMLVKRMLPAALTDDAQQRQLARMHVRIAVVRLVRILLRVVRIHVIGHRASVDHEVRGMVGLGRHVETASRRPGGAGSSRGDLRKCLRVNIGIQLGELEQVLAVVASVGVVVCCL